MGLFNKTFSKGEENNNCSCGGNCHSKEESDKARFIVLGACCKKSIQTYENTKIAVKELGLSDEVINIGDVTQIASYGVMSTPALVVDGKVVSYGKLLQIEDIKKLIAKNL